MSREGTESTSLLARGLDVLNFVAGSDHPVELADISRALDLPKATAHRICRTLQEMGLLARDLQPRRLNPGPGLLAMSLRALQSTSRLAPRRAILRQLVEETGETSTLTILDCDELVFLDRVESASPLRLQLYAGSRVPLHCTSAGKLFLSLLPPMRRARLLRARALKRYTDATITDPDALERELAEIRRERLGRDNQEFIEGLVAIAVPIPGPSSPIVAAVSVNGPATRLSLARKQEFVQPLRRAASALAKLMTEELRIHESLDEDAVDARVA